MLEKDELLKSGDSLREMEFPMQSAGIRNAGDVEYRSKAVVKPCSVNLTPCPSPKERGIAPFNSPEGVVVNGQITLSCGHPSKGGELHPLFRRGRGVRLAAFAVVFLAGILFVPLKTYGGGYVTVGTGTTTNNQTPIGMFYNYSWTRQIYLASELSSASSGGVITHLAWDYNYTSSFSKANQKCYFKAVNDAAISSAAYIDPIADGATLVWQGTYTANAGRTWAEIALTMPFTLPPGQNLMVYWINESALNTGSAYVFNHNTTVSNMAVYNQYDLNFPITAGTLTTARPNARFLFAYNNSVAMNAFVSPKAIETAGVSTPVKVVIQNAGTNNLTSCTIGWKIDGISQSPYSYVGNLPQNATDTVSLGTYTPVLGLNTTIMAYVSQPNGVLDSISFDDTLAIMSKGCGTPLSGTVSVGAGSTYTTLASVLTVLKDCGAGGDITLSLRSGNYNESLDLSNLSNLMGNYQLTITSAANHPDSVVIRPPSGVGMTLNNTNNLSVKAVTVTTSTATAYTISFIGACTNVVFQDCKLLANPSATGNTSAAVYKGSGTGIVKNISFINNVIDGGYYGIYFYGGTSTAAYGTNIVFDNNTVSNSYYYATYFYYADFASCSYNTISCRTANYGLTWYGLFFSYANGQKVIGNKILQRNASITSPYGIYLYYYGYYNTSDTGLIANNEIVLNTTGAYNGISISSSSKAKILHNSVYIAGGTARGIYISNSTGNYLVVKNNNIVTTGTSAYPIYFSATGNLQLYNMNYNNYYAPTYVGYYGSNITSMSAWQMQVTSDLNSVMYNPTYTNVANSLELSSYTNFLCPKMAEVNVDINGYSRASSTTMGAYERPPSAANILPLKMYPSNDSIVDNQSVAVSVDVKNTGNAAVTSAVLAWSVNGVRQPNARTTFSPNLALLAQQTMNLGNFLPNANTAVKYQVAVWADSINGAAATIKDTLFRTYVTPPKDLFVSKILISPQITACNATNKNISVVVQAIGSPLNFSTTPTSIVLEIPGSANVNYPLQGILQAGRSDTLLIASNKTLQSGTIRAYASTSIDVNKLNDTASLALNLNPSPTNYNAYMYQCGTYSDANFKNLTTAGTYRDTLQNIYGCDSVVVLTLALNPTPNQGGTTGPLTWSFNLCDSTLTISGNDTMPDYSIMNAPWYASFRTIIKRVVIGNNVTSIGNYAFYNCVNVDSATIPNTVARIGTQAFGSCNTMVYAAIGNNVASIGTGAFYGCSRLASITLPNSLKTIGTQALSNCSRLPSITIPASVDDIGSSAFSGDDSLMAINVNANNLRYSSLNGMLYSKLQDTLVACPGGIAGAVVVPNSVTVIGDYAFNACSGLTSITLPNNVTRLGTQAFTDCINLTYLNIPNTITSIGGWAFGYCSKLTSINIPNRIKVIENQTFYACSGLTSITIPDSVTNIGNYAFNGCTGLTSITCNPVTPPTLGSTVFTNVPTAIPVYVPCSSVSTYKAASQWSNFTNITGSGIIASGTCGTSLTWNVACDSTLTISGNGTMTNYSSSSRPPWYASYRNMIKTLVIGDSVTGLGNDAFSGCTRLTSVIIGKSVTSFGDYVFNACTNLTSITIPNGVTNLGISTFKDCPLVSVSIPNSVKTIGVYVFEQCTNLKIVNLGDSITSIGTWAFYNCNKLDTIISGATTPPSIADANTFYNVPTTAKVYVPCSSVSTYRAAYQWSRFTNYVASGSNLTIYAASTCYFPYSDANFSNLPQAGTYYDTLQTLSGCDSIIELTLTDGRSFTSYAATVCQGSPYSDIHFSNLTQAGIYYDTLQNVNGCDSIIELTLSNPYYGGITGTLTWVFNGCDSSLSISGVGAIPNYSSSNLPPWYGDYRGIIKTVVIGDSVTAIGDNAFNSCPQITAVNIGNAVAAIGSSVFYGCLQLDAINAGSANPRYSSISGILYNKLQDTLVMCPPGKAGTVTIPNAAKAIKDGAFYNCKNLTSVVIPNTIATIAGYTFQNCSGLTSITFPNSIRTIGNLAFDGCSGLTSVTIPDSITSIGDAAFQACSKLQTVNFNAINCTMSNGIQGVNIYPVFNNCASFNTLNIGNQVKRIPNFGFCGCLNLLSVTIPDNVTAIGSYAFYLSTNLASVTIGDGVASIGDWAFYDCTSLTSITCNAVMPPTPGTTIFTNVPTTAAVYVPCNSMGLYKLTSQWSRFPNYQCIVVSIPITTYAASICSGKTYTDSHFSKLTIAGIYYDTLQSVGGSDSIIELTLTVYPAVAVTNYSASINSGAVYNDQNFQNLTQAGQYYDTLQNANGCDSIICLTLSVTVIPITNYSVSICNGKTYTDIHFTNLTQTGQYYDTLQSVNGGDSIVCLILSVYPAVPITNYARSICTGSTYTDANFSNLTITGIYRDTLQNVNGCDSVVELTLSVNPHSSLTSYARGICTGSTYTDANFSNLTITGIYRDTLQNVNGCDSVVELTLSVNPHSSLTNYAVMLCYGETYNDANFKNLTIAGTYYDTLQNINGCDSVLCLTLGFYPSIPMNSYAASICSGGSHTDIHFTNLTQAGIYYDTLQNANGCDSIFELTLSVTSIPLTNYTASICSGNSYTDTHFSNLTQSGIYYDTLQGVSGCDSVIALTLSVSSIPPTKYAASICPGKVYKDANFSSLKQAGVYYKTLLANNGCDSLVELTLSVYPQVPVTHYAATICKGNTYSDALFSNLTKAGQYYDTLTSVNGCDSLICLTLTVLTPAISQNGLTLTSNSPTGNQWYLNGTLISGATQQTYQCVQDGNYAVEVSYQQGCTAKSEEVLVTTIHVTKAALNNHNLNLYVGNTAMLIATLTPINATNKVIHFSSLNNGIASVSSSGTVTANTVGSTAIVVASDDGNFTDTCQITVTTQVQNVPVSGIRILSRNMPLLLQESKFLFASVLPSNATNKGLTAVSTNSFVATIDETFTVNAHAKGSAYIIFTTDDGGFKDSCLVTVTTEYRADISGTVYREDETTLQKGVVFLYLLQSREQFIISDTALINNDGTYLFKSVFEGTYIIKAEADSAENALPTYYGNTEHWYEAVSIIVDDTLPIPNQNIAVIGLPILTGNSLISGYVGQEGNGQKSIQKSAVSNPAVDVNVYLQSPEDTLWITIAQTVTDEDGYFEFKKIPAGDFRLILDVPGLEMNNPRTVTIINDGDTVNGQGYELTTDSINQKDIIPLVSIMLSERAVTIDVNEDRILTVIFNPSDASNQDVLWISRDENIATVDAFGVIRGIAKGETYIVVVSDEDENLRDSCKVTVSDVGIVSPTLNNLLRVYPNPTNGQLTIDNGEFKENTVIEIYDVIGRILNNYQLSIVNYQLIIDVSHLAKGMYYLKVGNQVTKFIKE